MMVWGRFGVVFFLSFLFSLGFGRLILPLLRKWHVIDHPNARSSHARPTPRGGGLAITKTMMLGGLLLAFVFRLPFASFAPLFGIVAVAWISWMDDRKGVPARYRFLIQVAAVALPLFLMPQERLVFAGFLPLVPDRMLAGLCWLWFINLFNFMDGIDGIAAGEAFIVSMGLAFVGVLSGQADAFVHAALVVAGASLGFLVWNWHPARMFMGDVGSIPLGYVLGWMLILLASRGHLFPALILPLYFVADASLTLARRALRGEKVWQAHREHFYQKAVQGGRRHDHVSGLVILVGIFLVAIAVASIWLGWVALVAACVPVIALLWVFSHPRPQKDGEESGAAE